MDDVDRLSDSEKAKILASARGGMVRVEATVTASDIPNREEAENGNE